MPSSQRCSVAQGCPEQLHSTGCPRAVSPREMTAPGFPKLMVTAGALSAGRCAAALGAQEGQGQAQQCGGTAGTVLPGHAPAGTVLGVLSYPKNTAASRVSEMICGDSKSLPECLSQERRQAAPRSGCRCPRRAHQEAGGGAGLSCHQHPVESRTRAGLVVGGELWALPPPPCSNFQCRAVIPGAPAGAGKAPSAQGAAVPFPGSVIIIAACFICFGAGRAPRGSLPPCKCRSPMQKPPPGPLLLGPPLPCSRGRAPSRPLLHEIQKAALFSPYFR